MPGCSVYGPHCHHQPTLYFMGSGIKYMAELVVVAIKYSTDPEGVLEVMNVRCATIGLSAMSPGTITQYTTPH